MTMFTYEVKFDAISVHTGETKKIVLRYDDRDTAVQMQKKINSGNAFNAFKDHAIVGRQGDRAAMVTVFPNDMGIEEAVTMGAFGH